MLDDMTIPHQIRQAARLKSRIDAYARETGVDATSASARSALDSVDQILRFPDSADKNAVAELFLVDRALFTRDGREETTLELFRQEHGHGLSAFERGILNSWARAATLGWFEVVAHHGDHAVVVDLGTTLDHTVTEVPGAKLLRDLRSGRFLHARLLPVDRIWLACAPIAVGAERLREKIRGHVAQAATVPSDGSRGRSFGKGGSRSSP